MKTLPAAGAAILLLASCWPAWSAPVRKPDSIVAQDGSGNFTTVQAAIDAAPVRKQPFVIHLKPGSYKEVVTIPHTKGPIRLEGEDAATTVITFANAANTPGPDGKPMGTFNSATVFEDADDFTAENVTFENTFGIGSQALAISVGGDRAIFRNCRFLAWQDTMLLRQGRQYFDHCTIAGHVDFIFGAGTAWFEQCELHCRGNGAITAASTPQEAPFGFVFSHCRITAEPNLKTCLGRPWRPFASVTFLNTEMPDTIRPQGWDNWNSAEKEKTARYAEYHSTGPGAAPEQRAPWAKQLTDEEAGAITVVTVLAGKDGWHPR